MALQDQFTSQMNTFRFVRKPRRKQIFLLFIACILTLMGVTTYLSTQHAILHDTMEYIEYKTKHNSFHSYYNHLSDENTFITLLSNESKIFFIHVPRTSGDSIRAHLFNLKKQSLLFDFSTWDHKKWRIAPMLTESLLIKFAKYYIIKGRISYEYIVQYKQLYPQSNVKVVTVLRHPIERVLSLYRFFDRGTSGHLHLNISKSRSSMNISEFFSTKINSIYSLISNSMVWQFGNFLDNKYRNNSININDVYISALHAIKSMDYVAFYENMMNDFSELESNIFNGITGNELHRFVHKTGTYILYPRERVLKYCCLYNESDLWIAINHNLYDLKLYKEAKIFWKRTFNLYGSYPEMIGLNQITSLKNDCPQLKNKKIRKYLML